MICDALVQMPLGSSYLCADPVCGTVSNDSGHCPRCHSAVISMANVLNRETFLSGPEHPDGPYGQGQEG